MDSNREGSPRETVWGRTSLQILSEPTQCAQRCRICGVVIQRKKCDCGGVNVRLERGAENDAISCVPSSIGACAIEEHLCSQLDAFGGPSRWVITGEPLERNECESGGDDPT